MIKKEILQDLDRDDLRLPPYWITHPPRSAPPGLEAALMPDPGPGEVPAAATALLPALPEFTDPPFWQAPIPAMETSGQWPQNSTSAGPPRLYPPLSVCALPRNRGTNPTIDAPQRATTASIQDAWGTTFSPL